VSQGVLRARLAQWVEAPRIQRIIVGLIVLNAIVLGLETFPALMHEFGTVLSGLDRVLLGVFVVELALKLIGHGRRFFHSAWNVFDLLIIGIALVPATGVLRALRVLRVLRVISAVPRMRAVVEALVRSLPGIASIALLLLVFFYVFSVMATKLFGMDFPQWFGSLWASMFSLFQIMTLEGWAEIAREIMGRYPLAWVFFVIFILLATFTVLNLFIAVIVNAMQDPAMSGDGDAASPRLSSLPTDIAALRHEIDELRVELRRIRSAPAAVSPEEQGARGD
jgi:voltage-gated sodium channel